MSIYLYYIYITLFCKNVGKRNQNNMIKTKFRKQNKRLRYRSMGVTVHEEHWERVGGLPAPCRTCALSINRQRTKVPQCFFSVLSLSQTQMFTFYPFFIHQRP